MFTLDEDEDFQEKIEATLDQLLLISDIDTIVDILRQIVNNGSVTGTVNIDGDDYTIVIDEDVDLGLNGDP